MDNKRENQHKLAFHENELTKHNIDTTSSDEEDTEYDSILQDPQKSRELFQPRINKYFEERNSRYSDIQVPTLHYLYDENIDNNYKMITRDILDGSYRPFSKL